MTRLYVVMYASNPDSVDLFGVYSTEDKAKEACGDGVIWYDRPDPAHDLHGEDRNYGYWITSTVLDGATERAEGDT